MASAQYAKKDLSEEERWLHIALYSKGPKFRACEPIVEQNADLMLYEIFRNMIPKYDDDPGLFAKFSNIASKLISDGVSSGAIRRGEGSIWLAEHAMPAAKEEWDALPISEASGIFFSKKHYNNATRDGAKCCLYSIWPDLAKDAGEYSWFEKNRKDLAFAFYRDGGISISGAASISGMAHEDFMIEMGKRGIIMR